MNISKISANACAGLLAVAFSASAALAAPVISSVDVSQPIPFTLENFGTSTTAGFVSSAALTLSTGVNVSFTPLDNVRQAGIYSGNVNQVSQSPFNYFGIRRSNYLSVLPGGSIVMDYGSNSYTAFNLLWSTVDTSNNTDNLLTFSSGNGTATQTISGKQIRESVGASHFGADRFVSISNLDPFTQLTITATKIAFEFVPGTAVPEPGSLALLGLGLAGLAAVARRKSKQV